jgi:general stress protein 26
MPNSKRANGEEQKERGTLDELWKLVDGIETAMLTTRRSDGHLVSRPMATQKRSSGADFWFVTDRSSPKVREIAAEPRVNLAYYRDGTREWVSVSGDATVTDDRGKILELWAPDWKAWFGDEGGEKDGEPDDPRMVLIAVKAVSAQYMTVNKPKPLVLFELAKGMLTGKAPDVGEVKEVPIKNRRTGSVRIRRPARGERA